MSDQAFYSGPTDVDIEIDLDMIVDKIIANPRLLKKLAYAVLRELTKQARRTGNLFSIWAQGQR